jgi:hypothetical protein
MSGASDGEGSKVGIAAGPATSVVASAALTITSLLFQSVTKVPRSVPTFDTMAASASPSTSTTAAGRACAPQARNNSAMTIQMKTAPT